MVQSADIDNLLSTGSWSTQRAKGPRPLESPIDVNQSQKLSRRVPRSFSFPPSPLVEDEADSLAKEWGSLFSSLSDEEPKSRGEPDQTPIILPVAAHNSEPHFVLVPNESKVGSDGYEANSCQKYVVVDCNGKAKAKLHSKHPSDLPPIDTHAEGDKSPKRRTVTREKRRVQNVTVTQNQHEGLEGREDSHGFLSPLIQHATKGKERAYWGFNRKAAEKLMPRSRTGRERCGPQAYNDDGQQQISRSPATEKRPVVDFPKYERGRHRSDEEDRRTCERNQDQVRERGAASPAKNEKTSRSPPYPSSEKESTPSTMRSDERWYCSPAQDNKGYCGSQWPDQSTTRHRRTIVSAGHQDRPVHAKEAPSHRPEKRSTTPLSSPQAIVGDALPKPDHVMSRRHSYRPPEMYPDKADSPSPSPFWQLQPVPSRSKSSRDESEQPSRPGRTRDMSVNNAPVPAMGPVPMPPEREKSVMTAAREGTLSSSADFSPPTSWQPPNLEGSGNRKADKPIASYRRYSEEVEQGILPKLPECERMMARCGFEDWLTMPRADNFNMCPTCFNGVFAGTDLAHDVIPACRDPDKAVACDFGSSPWYRIAFLMTLKYGSPDLRLLRAVASVTTRHQPCTGSRSTTRLWLSMMDPASQAPIRTFPICCCCAKTVEALLPSLAGMFVPLTSASEQSHDVCELHWSPSRKRFVEYFDLLETTAKRVLARKSVSEIQSLANEIRRLSQTHSCLRSTLAPDRRWHSLDSLPDFTVCEECFDDVVWPLLESDADADVTGGWSAPTFARSKTFQRAQKRKMASCQLYSTRMRHVFRTAFRNNDLHYLERKFTERLDVANEIRDKLARQQQQGRGVNMQEQVAERTAEWNKWE